MTRGVALTNGFYETTAMAARRWRVSADMVMRYARDGRIPGARRIGWQWLIPAGAPKPPQRKRGPKPRPTTPRGA